MLAQARRKTDKSVNFQIVRHVRQGIRESGFLLLVGLAGFFAMALVSFDVNDPAWTHMSNVHEIRNWGGVTGAWFADIALYFFGYGAYMLPFGIAFGGWQLFRKGALNNLDAEIVVFRFLGVLVGFLSGCGLCSLQLVDIVGVGSAGGRIGVAVSEFLVNAFSFAGGSLLLVALFLAGITLATGLSWLGLVEFLGTVTLNVFKGLGVLGWRIAEWIWQAWSTSAVRGEEPPDLSVNKSQTKRAKKPADSSPASEPPSESNGPRLSRIEPLLEVPANGGYEEENTIEAPPRSESTEPLAAVALPSGSRCSGTPLEVGAVSNIEPALVVPATSARPVKAEPPSIASPGALAVIGAAGSAPQIAAGRRSEQTPRPPLNLLDGAPPGQNGYPPEILEEMSEQVEILLRHFNIDVRVTSVKPGPVITCFEMEPAPGVKVSQISNLSRDLARGLSVISVRVVEVIPGKSVMGLEIPNQRREIVYLSEIIKSSIYAKSSAPLTLALGKDIVGSPIIANLAKMPHLLVAGTTGSGKSVAINAMLLSMLYKAGPDQVRLILVDPKMLELSIYEGIPHLLAPVVTDMKEAANALRWCVGEMERRYRLMAALKVRNIAGYNRIVSDALQAGEPLLDPLQSPRDQLEKDEVIARLEPLPLIVVVIDELADMMMIVGKKVEELIARLAQKARASGIHLILATQRPSVDVITGLIKANIPTRIAFQVSSRVDSRTILDQMGAEQLLGHGDMLYLPPGTGFPQRVHGAFVDDHEVNQVVEYLRQTGEPEYMEDILHEPIESAGGWPGDDAVSGADGEGDPLYDQAVRLVTETRKASISGVQRRLKIGYNRAARMIEEMEEAGIVGPLQSNGTREVLAPPPPEI